MAEKLASLATDIFKYIILAKSRLEKKILENLSIPFREHNKCPFE